MSKASPDFELLLCAARSPVQRHKRPWRHSVMQRALSTIPRGRYDQAAALLGRALHDDPGSLALLKGMETRRRIRVLTAFFRAVLKKCGSRGLPLEATIDDEMAGACMVHRPLDYPPPVSTQVSILLEGFFRLWSPAAFGRWLKLLVAVEKRHPKRDCSNVTEHSYPVSRRC